MQKIALSVSITLLAISVLLVGIAIISPSFAKGIMSRVHPAQEETTVISQDFENTIDGEDPHNGLSAWILGDKTEIEPTPFSKQPSQQTYQPPALPPTTIPTQEPAVQQAPEQKLPWAGGFANKEAYCRDVASKEVAEVKLDPPYVDQSNTPPELRVTINWDAWWNSSYQDCMDFVRNY